MKYLIALLAAAMFCVGWYLEVHYFFDFSIYYDAGLKVLRGKAAVLYDLDRTYPGGYYYPYCVAWFFSKLCRLGRETAGHLYFYALFLAYLKIVALSVERARSLWPADKLPSRQPAVLVALLLSATAFYSAARYGNVSVFLLLFCLLAFEDRDRRPWLAGIWLGLAIATKLYPAVLIAYFAWRGNAKLVAAAAFSALALLWLPIVTEGWAPGLELVRAQILMPARFGSHWRYDSIVFQNLPSTFLGILLKAGIYAEWILPTFIAVCALTVAAFYWWRRDKRAGDTKLWFLGLALIPLLIPVSWRHMLVFATPVISYFTFRALDTGEIKARVALFVFAFLYCLTAPELVGERWYDTLCRLRVPFLGMATLIGLYVSDVWRDERPLRPAT